MKTKNKTIALVEIAIVLCSVFIVATLPAAAITNYESGITNYEETASEDDYVLGVYGNANEDDTIDMRDLTYVKLIFFGKKPETELADAKYDGKINPLDFIQIKLIIVGKDKELTIVDSADRIVTVKKPVERIVVFTDSLVEAMRSIHATGEIVGVGKYTPQKDVFFPEFRDYPVVGSPWSPDYEAVLALDPDAVFTYASYGEAIQDKLEELDPSIATVCLDCCAPLIYAEEVTKLAYVLGRREEGRVFLKFYDGFMDTIEERVSDIPEEDKTKVYLEAHYKYVAVGTGSGRHAMIVTAGGKNIFDDLSGTFDIDAEEVVRLDPQVIIKTDWSVGGFETDDVTGISATRDEIMGRKELADVTAVKDKRVYVVSDKFPGGVEFFVGTGNYAKWLHPALFEDFDPMEYLQEYLTTFQQLDFDVSEHGVLVYHPEQHPDGH
jgi:iron complex transport system substrate-binding protein